MTLPEGEDLRAADGPPVDDPFAHLPRPFVMPVLLAANVLVFVAMLIAGVSPISPDPELLRQWGAAYGPLITGGDWWRLFTATFLHAGILHLLFNMFALVSIGSLIERVFGYLSFLMLYLLAGLAGSIASVYWHPLSVGVGASGAIFGLYGGLLGYLLWARKSLPGDVLQSLRNGAIGFVLFNTAFGLTLEGVDMAAHFGGFAAGVLAGAALASPVMSAASGARVWKGLLVGCAGAVALALAAARLPVIDDWPAALRTLAAFETRDTAAVDAAMSKVNDGGIQADEFARLIEEQVVGPWRRHRERIAGMRRLPDKERALAVKAVQYMDRRIAAWQLEAEAFRTQDVALMQKSNVEHAAASTIAADLMRSLGARATAATPPPAQAGASPGARDLERAMQVAAQLEAASMQLYNNGLDRVRSGQLSEAAFAALIETQVSEPWEAQYQRLQALRVSGPVEGARQRAGQYMRLRGEAWRLTVRAMRTHSEALAKQANFTHMKATAILAAGGSGAGTTTSQPSSQPSPSP
jgi:membrane associated rhomboid family serine protease